MAVDNVTIEHWIAWLSWLLAALSNLRYAFGRRSPWDHGHQYDVAFTPFTANIILVAIFWGITLLAQAAFLSTSFVKAGQTLSRQYILNNVLLLAWSYLFSRAHYFLSEVVIVLAFLNAVYAYLFNKTYAIRPLRDWLLIHVPVVVLPFTWAMYVVFWNGAVLFAARNLLSRLVANIFIWTYLIVPGFFVLVFGDWALGLFNAHFALAIGVGQLLVKAFALQWIFAFVIAGLLALLSIFTMVARPQSASQAEQAPLLSNA